MRSSLYCILYYTILLCYDIRLRTWKNIVLNECGLIIIFFFYINDGIDCTKPETNKYSFKTEISVFVWIFSIF